jgi:hypothetical protein
MDQVKKAFKGLFKKKSKKEEHPNPTATTDTPSSTAPVSEPAKTETAPAPVPATAPEPAKTDVAPASSAPEPAQPAPAATPAHGEVNKDEVAALAEVKEATHSKSTSLSILHISQVRSNVFQRRSEPHPPKVSLDRPRCGFVLSQPAL